MSTYVIGFDGSDTAAIAAARAGELALAAGAAVHVVCAVTRREAGTVGVGSDSMVISSVTMAEQIAEQQAATYRSQGLEATSVAVERKPADALLAEAERLQASMIVVGNRRMQGMGRVLGSVANEIAHHSPCDVLIVKTV